VILNSKPPGNRDLISREFLEIAGFGLPALFGSWCFVLRWLDFHLRTIPLLGLEDIKLTEQLCSTVIDNAMF
jgi:hypothetical protein